MNIAPFYKNSKSSGLEEISAISYKTTDSHHNEKSVAYLLVTFEKNYNKVRLRTLKSSFVRLQGKFNQYLRQKIAVAKIYRMIKNNLEAKKLDALNKLCDAIPKLSDFSERSKKFLTDKLPREEGPSDLYEIFNSYLADKTPKQHITRESIDKAFAAKKIVSAVNSLVHNSRAKFDAFSALKQLIFMKKQEKSFSLDTSIPYVKSMNSKTDTKDELLKEKFTNAVKKLSDLIFQRKESAFYQLKTQAALPNTPNSSNGVGTPRNSYKARFSNFFESRRARKMKSQDEETPRGDGVDNSFGSIKSQDNNPEHDTINLDSSGGGVELIRASSTTPAAFPTRLSSFSPFRAQSELSAGNHDRKSSLPSKFNGKTNKRANLTTESEGTEERSERESMIVERLSKLNKIVLGQAASFKDKKVEKYLRYEHTCYQIVRIFKGALKRELYYSFENLKNLGKYDSQTQKRMVRIINQWKGQTERKIHKYFLLWRDNAKKRQLSLNILRKLVSVLTSRRNGTIEKAFLKIQLCAVAAGIQPQTHAQASSKRNVAKRRTSARKIDAVEATCFALIIEKLVRLHRSTELAHGFRAMQSLWKSSNSMRDKSKIADGAVRIRKVIAKIAYKPCFKKFKRVFLEAVSEDSEPGSNLPSPRKIEKSFKESQYFEGKTANVNELGLSGGKVIHKDDKRGLNGSLAHETPTKKTQMKSNSINESNKRETEQPRNNFDGNNFQINKRDSLLEKGKALNLKHDGKIWKKEIKYSDVEEKFERENNRLSAIKNYYPSNEEISEGIAEQIECLRIENQRSTYSTEEEWSDQTKAELEFINHENEILREQLEKRGRAKVSSNPLLVNNYFSNHIERLGFGHEQDQGHESEALMQYTSIRNGDKGSSAAEKRLNAANVKDVRYTEEGEINVQREEIPKISYSSKNESARGIVQKHHQLSRRRLESLEKFLQLITTKLNNNKKQALKALKAFSNVRLRETQQNNSEKLQMFNPHQRSDSQDQALHHQNEKIQYIYEASIPQEGARSSMQSNTAQINGKAFPSNEVQRNEGEIAEKFPEREKISLGSEQACSLEYLNEQNFVYQGQRMNVLPPSHNFPQIQVEQNIFSGSDDGHLFQSGSSQNQAHRGQRYHEQYRSPDNRAFTEVSGNDRGEPPFPSSTHAASKENLRTLFPEPEVERKQYQSKEISNTQTDEQNGPTDQLPPAESSRTQTSEDVEDIRKPLHTFGNLDRFQTLDSEQRENHPLESARFKGMIDPEREYFFGNEQGQLISTNTQLQQAQHERLADGQEAHRPASNVGRQFEHYEGTRENFRESQSSSERSMDSRRQSQPIVSSSKQDVPQMRTFQESDQLEFEELNRKAQSSTERSLDSRQQSQPIVSSSKQDVPQARTFQESDQLVFEEISRKVQSSMERRFDVPKITLNQSKSSTQLYTSIKDKDTLHLPANTHKEQTYSSMNNDRAADHFLGNSTKSTNPENVKFGSRASGNYPQEGVAIYDNAQDLSCSSENSTSRSQKRVFQGQSSSRKQIESPESSSRLYNPLSSHQKEEYGMAAFGKDQMTLPNSKSGLAQDVFANLRNLVELPNQLKKNPLASQVNDEYRTSQLNSYNGAINASKNPLASQVNDEYRPTQLNSYKNTINTSNNPYQRVMNRIPEEKLHSTPQNSATSNYNTISQSNGSQSQRMMPQYQIENAKISTQILSPRNEPRLKFSLQEDKPADKRGGSLDSQNLTNKEFNTAPPNEGNLSSNQQQEKAPTKLQELINSTEVSKRPEHEKEFNSKLLKQTKSISTLNLHGNLPHGESSSRHATSEGNTNTAEFVTLVTEPGGPESARLKLLSPLELRRMLEMSRVPSELNYSKFLDSNQPPGSPRRDFDTPHPPMLRLKDLDNKIQKYKIPSPEKQPNHSGVAEREKLLTTQRTRETIHHGEIDSNSQEKEEFQTDRIPMNTNRTLATTERTYHKYLIHDEKESVAGTSNDFTKRENEYQLKQRKKNSNQRPQLKLNLEPVLAGRSAQSGVKISKDIQTESANPASISKETDKNLSDLLWSTGRGKEPFKNAFALKIAEIYEMKGAGLDTAKSSTNRSNKEKQSKLQLFGISSTEKDQPMSHWTHSPSNKMLLHKHRSSHTSLLSPKQEFKLGERTYSKPSLPAYYSEDSTTECSVSSPKYSSAQLSRKGTAPDLRGYLPMYGENSIEGIPENADEQTSNFPTQRSSKESVQCNKWDHCSNKKCTNCGKVIKKSTVVEVQRMPDSFRNLKTEGSVPNSSKNFKTVGNKKGQDPKITAFTTKMTNVKSSYTTAAKSKYY